MILWDISIKEYEADIESMNQFQQFRFAACCICEILTHFFSKKEEPINELLKINCKESVLLSSLIADNIIFLPAIKDIDDLINNLGEFVYCVEESYSNVPGLHDISMALLTLTEAIKDHSIKDWVLEIASYSYQSILDEQLMFDLPEGGVLESELVHLEKQNLVCNRTIATQIEWCERIRNNILILPMFETLRQQNHFL
jgi:hypothetical protein